MSELNWEPSPQYRDAAECATDGAKIFRAFNRDGLFLQMKQNGYFYSDVTLTPADALALARDILKEYGGQE